MAEQRPFPQRVPVWYRHQLVWLSFDAYAKLLLTGKIASRDDGRAGSIRG